MAVRVLVMFSLMILELGGGIAAIVGVTGEYRYTPMDEGGIAACVMLVVAILVSWLLTIAFFIRKSARTKAMQAVEDAKAQAARILSEAMDKSMALCSLDAGRCSQCGNPRTGNFCPKCGKAAQRAVVSADIQGFSRPATNAQSE